MNHGEINPGLVSLYMHRHPTDENGYGLVKCLQPLAILLTERNEIVAEIATKRNEPFYV